MQSSRSERCLERRHSAAALDDICQLTRVKILVPTSEGPPKIAEYTGQGSLLGWVRAIADPAVLCELVQYEQCATVKPRPSWPAAARPGERQRRRARADAGDVHLVARWDVAAPEDVTRDDGERRAGHTNLGDKRASRGRHGGAHATRGRARGTARTDLISRIFYPPQSVRP